MQRDECAVHIELSGCGLASPHLSGYPTIAMHDDLTNAFNRRYLLEYANLEIERCKRYGHRLNLLMIDIDEFKKINDNFGHNVGDETL